MRMFETASRHGTARLDSGLGIAGMCSGLIEATAPLRPEMPTGILSRFKMRFSGQVQRRFQAGVDFAHERIG